MRKSRLTSLFLPPAVATAFVIFFIVWVLWEESTAPPRYIEGRVDDAPARAAAVLLVLTPFVFVILLIAQALANKLARNRFRRLIAAYMGEILMLSGGIGVLSLLSGDKPSKAAEGFALFLFIGFCLLLPMALTTWWAYRRPVNTYDEGHK